MINIYYVSENKIPSLPDNVACIGFFDGVHLGHQALIHKTVKEAKKLNVEPILITFYPDPADIISSSKVNHINSFERRVELFEHYGIKAVVVIEFNKEVMSLSKENFVKTYLNNFNLKGLVCGFDFHYGYKGEGDYYTLNSELKNICPVYEVEEVTLDNEKVSSTRIKKEIEKKNYAYVDRLLGYHYEH